jgi:hypothetical protein
MDSREIQRLLATEPHRWIVLYEENLELLVVSHGILQRRHWAIPSQSRTRRRRPAGCAHAAYRRNPE